MIQRALNCSGDRILLRDARRTWSGRELCVAAQALHAHHGQSFPWVTFTAETALIVAAVAAVDEARQELLVVHPTLTREQAAEIARAQGAGTILTAFAPTQAAGAKPSARDGEGRVCVMTSGTTGTPKIARHSIRALFGTVARNSSSENARWLLTFPPTSFAGLQVTFAAVLGGGELVVPADRTPAAFADAIGRFGITHVSGTPTFWRALLMAAARREDFRTIKQATLGGEAADQATLDRIASACPEARLTQIYASTEAGSLFSVNDGRAGIPASWVESGINAVQLRVRERVLEVKSPRAMAGYVSGHVCPVAGDGWLNTGDLVARSGDRYLFLGRADRRLNVGGFKVPPEEVETVLLSVPGVLDARVYGTPSPLTGEVVTAEVVPCRSADVAALRKEILTEARTRLEPFKLPRVLRFVSAVETSEFGKKAR